MFIILFCTFIFYFVFSVLWYCFAYCFLFLYICLFPIFIKVYRPLPPSGKQIAVNKYHISNHISYHIWYINPAWCIYICQPCPVLSCEGWAVNLDRIITLQILVSLVRGLKEKIRLMEKKIRTEMRGDSFTRFVRSCNVVSYLQGRK
jgi:hypothetical protein